jgi:hypothetical protein
MVKKRDEDEELKEEKRSTSNCLWTSVNDGLIPDLR